MSSSTEVSSCAFAPDGLSIVTASADKNLYLWNIVTGKCQATLVGHEKGVTSCSFAPDGRTVASASHDGTVRVWDVATGECQSVFKGHKGAVIACAFSPVGRTIASGSWDGTVRVWDVATGECMRVLEHGGLASGAVANGLFKGMAHIDPMLILASKEGVVCCAFSPDGRSIVSSTDCSVIRIWDVAKGVCQVERPHCYGSSCAFSPDGLSIVSGAFSSEATLRLWDAGTGHSKRVFEAQYDPINSAAFSPDGRSIVSAGQVLDPDTTAAANALHIWDVETGKSRVLDGHEGDVSWAVFSPDGTKIASAGADGDARIWNVASGECECIFEHATADADDEDNAPSMG